jgi:hypothetical protein
LNRCLVSGRPTGPSLKYATGRPFADPGKAARKPLELANAVEPIHPKAMPVILTTDEKRDVWMCAPLSEAKAAGKVLLMIRSPCSAARAVRSSTVAKK